MIVAVGAALRYCPRSVSITLGRVAISRHERRREQRWRRRRRRWWWWWRRWSSGWRVHRELLSAGPVIEILKQENGADDESS